ncbi:MAG: hypothetical protein L6R42_006259 [Xanthoria sp. 1 TBL-2021]|nr:MAG: hypothetical protein L6R42_006259 [Xanthoria sp. 1 TBL-2021]
MAPTQKAEAAGKGRKTQVLGKRPGGQSGKSTPESLPKRSKLTTGSPPVAGTKVKQGKSKPSLSHVDDDIDKENVDPENIDPNGGDVDDDDEFLPDEDPNEIDEAAGENVRFNMDPEPAEEDEDGTKAAIQEQEVKAWMKEAEQNDQLKSLGAEERQARIEECAARYTFMLTEVKRTAQGIPKGDYFIIEQGRRLPFTFYWWSYFVALSVEVVVTELMLSLPEAVKVILGGPMTTEELMMLPKKWRGATFWAIYADVMFDAADDTEAMYCGSGSSADGASTRLGWYEKVIDGRVKPKPILHEKMLAMGNITANFRVFSVFNIFTTAKPYVMVMEFLSSILLQSTSLIEGFYLKPSTLAMIKRATPPGLREAKHKRVNKAAQCLQGLYHRRPKGSIICSNCQTSDSKFWFSAIPGMPFGKRICCNCWGYRRNNPGKDRPANWEARLDRENALGKPPPKGGKCPGCNRVVQKWLLPSAGDWKDEPGRQRWECKTFSRKPTDKLCFFSDAMVARKAISGKLKHSKPAINTPCPGCGKLFTKGCIKLPDDPFFHEPVRQRHECVSCSKKPTNLLAG